jgi:hypothetical protein
MVAPNASLRSIYFYRLYRTVRAMAVAGAERGGQEVGGRPDVHV